MLRDMYKHIGQRLLARPEILVFLALCTAGGVNAPLSGPMAMHGPLRGYASRLNTNGPTFMILLAITGGIR